MSLEGWFFKTFVIGFRLERTSEPESFETSLQRTEGLVPMEKRSALHFVGVSGLDGARLALEADVGSVHTG